MHGVIPLQGLFSNIPSKTNLWKLLCSEGVWSLQDFKIVKLWNIIEHLKPSSYNFTFIEFSSNPPLSSTWLTTTKIATPLAEASSSNLRKSLIGWWAGDEILCAQLIRGSVSIHLQMKITMWGYMHIYNLAVLACTNHNYIQTSANLSTHVRKTNRDFLWMLPWVHYVRTYICSTIMFHYT